MSIEVQGQNQCFLLSDRVLLVRANGCDFPNSAGDIDGLVTVSLMTLKTGTLLDKRETTVSTRKL